MCSRSRESLWTSGLWVPRGRGETETRAWGQLPQLGSVQQWDSPSRGQTSEPQMFLCCLGAVFLSSQFVPGSQHSQVTLFNIILEFTYG